MLARDRRRAFRFATLQSERARRVLEPLGIDPGALDSVVVLDEGRALVRSTAALRILRGMGPPWSVLCVFSVVPAPIRDAVYRVIAKNRYRLFGRRETCRTPSPAERTLFLPDIPSDHPADEQATTQSHPTPAPRTDASDWAYTV